MAQPWSRVLVSHQGIHTKVSLSYFIDTKTSTRWEKLTTFCPQAHTQDRLEPEMMMLTPTSLTTSQSEECPWADHTLLNLTIKLLTLHRSEHTVLRALLLWLPLPYCCCFHSLSRVWLFATPWTAARQASDSFLLHSKLCLWGSVLYGRVLRPNFSISLSSTTAQCHPLVSPEISSTTLILPWWDLPGLMVSRTVR